MDLDSVCTDLNAVKRALAKLVYADILNDERLIDIQPQFERSLNLFYLSAQKQEDNQQVAYIPLPHSKDIDFKQINSLQKLLPKSLIFMAIADNTGNILYYQITEGFNEK
ncbi:uncharacterized protein LOC132792445 [Drosophila nasuta]|uniref:uncharacterized protein LOC132792445 n=1 Tax=Drosophila nasuta TaxID=42062 RepID=UPI00295EAFC5|nr:uncharacterized protein LOC132792445 [Drosophila nasuta]